MKIKHTNSAEEPLVSIITPLFNASQFIAQTLESVQAQTYQNWEQIVVDDASTDGCAEIVAQFASKDDRIRLVKLDENKGAAYCRNQATQLAQGLYVAFLDSDDLWHPEKLQRQIRFMTDENCPVSFSSYLHIDENGNMLGKRIKALRELPYKKQLRNNYIGNLTGIYNADVLGKILAPNIRKRQDWAVWLEAIQKSGKPAQGIPEDLAFYRVRSGSISANKWNLVKFNFRFYRHYLGNSWMQAVFNLLRFFWEYFVERPKQIEKL